MAFDKKSALGGAALVVLGLIVGSGIISFNFPWKLVPAYTPYVEQAILPPAPFVGAPQQTGFVPRQVAPQVTMTHVEDSPIPPPPNAVNVTANTGDHQYDALALALGVPENRHITSTTLQLDKVKECTTPVNQGGKGGVIKNRTNPDGSITTRCIINGQP